MKTPHFCIWSKWSKSIFSFVFLFHLIKCLMSSYHLRCKSKPKTETFMCDFILFPKNEIKAIFELEYMSSVLTFVQYRMANKYRSSFSDCVDMRRTYIELTSLDLTVGHFKSCLHVSYLHTA